MSDHHHYDYAQANHDHREYASDGHDHYDYAGRHHRHYDDEADVKALRDELRRALERISALEAKVHGIEQLSPAGAFDG